MQTLPAVPDLPSISCESIHTIRHLSWTESHVTLPDLHDTNQNLLLESFLNDPLNLFAGTFLFGDDSSLAAARRKLKSAGIDAPEIALRLPPGAPGGIQIAALSGANATPLYGERRLIGWHFEDSDAKYCLLGAVHPSDPSAPPGHQTFDVLCAIRNALESVGMEFRHVARTWFYNDRILDWYAEFNRARIAFYQQHGVSLPPASTGIGVANAGGGALAARAIAVMPKTDRVTVRRVESPLQCEASKYGSLFSRAVEIADPAARLLFVSGTASINLGGMTARSGDAMGQIEKTMEVVEALLAHHGTGLSDVTRAIAYFRDREHIPLWRQYCDSRRLPPLPVILTECTICRDELLFEIELDAVLHRHVLE